MTRKRLITVGSIAGLAVFAMAQRFMPHYDPMTVLPASGLAKLTIVPHEPSDSSPADYKVTVKGNIAWEKTLPYTLSETGICDSGLIGGVGRGDRKAKADEKDFVIVIIDPKGNSLLEDRIPVTMSRYVDAGFDPKCSGVVFDPENDRMSVRLRDYDVNRQQETWRVYQLSTGKRQPDIQPSLPNTLFLLNARPVKGTHYLATTFYRLDGTEMGLTYGLMDYKGSVVWSQDAIGDLSSGSTGYSQYDLQEQAFQGDGIPDNPKPNEFTIRSYKNRQLITFAVSGSEPKVSVREVSREAVKEPANTTGGALSVKIATIPVTASLIIPKSKSTQSGITKTGQFNFCGDDKVVFLQEQEPARLGIVDVPTLKVRAIKLPSEATAKGTTCLLAKVSGARFLLVSTKENNFGKTEKQATVNAWTVEVTNGTWHRLPSFRSFGVKAVAARSDGKFAVLSSEQQLFSSTEHLSFCDATGKQIWMQGEGGYRGKKGEMLSPEALDFDNKGHIVVLDNIKKSLIRTSPAGLLDEEIELKKAWYGKEPTYPTNIMCLPSGGIVLTDSDTDKVCYVLNAKGGIVRKLEPRLANGKNIYVSENVRADSKGDIWITNGDGFFRLNAQGISSQVVGNSPNQAGLGEILSVHIDLDGRVYAQDGSTYAVHVFDRTGKPLFAAVPKPTEFSERAFADGPDVTRSGDIYLQGSKNDGIIHFSPTGERLADVPYPKDKKGSDGLFEMKPTWRWWGTTLLSEKNEPVAELRRWPDGAWMLGGPSATAPDGRIMAYSKKSYRAGGFEANQSKRIAFFAANGRPESMAAYPFANKFVYSTAYDGTDSYFVLDEYIAAVDKNGSVLWAYQPEGWNPKDSFSVFCSMGKLALWDGKQKVIWIDPKLAKIGSKVATIPLEDK